MLRVLITGAEGQLGQAMMAQKPTNIEFIGCSKSELDVTDISQIERVFLQKKPHVIINCAAYTAVDQAENDAELAYLVNEQGVKNLAKVCKRKNIKVIQISTDYVFSGNTDLPYKESDLAQPINVYGQSKLAGEQAIKLLNGNALIIRSSWLISSYGHSFFKTILNALQNNQNLQIVDDQVGTATNANILAAWVVAALPMFWHGEIQGVYHATASTSCSWYELATKIQCLAKERGLVTTAATISAIDSEQFAAKKTGAVAKRPNNSSLCSDKFLQAVSQPPVSWQAMVKECFNS